MADIQISLPKTQIAEFCQRHHIQEFALFGSVLRDDFDPERSDIDIMLTEPPDAKWTLFDVAGMHGELEEIFGRRVDVVTRIGVDFTKNEALRQNILNSRQIIHAA